MRFALLLLLSGCVSPLAPIRWDPLPPLPLPELPPPGLVAQELVAGDVAPSSGLLLDPGDYLRLEARSEALPVLIDALEAERSGRLRDRALASEAFSEAREACRRRSRVACAVCAALAGVGSAAVVGGGAAAVCR